MFLQSGYATFNAWRVYIFKSPAISSKKMSKNLLVTLMIVFITSCQNSPGANVPAATPTRSVARADSSWSVYDPDPEHPWNKVFRQLYRRTTADGQEFGAGELDPLLWPDTTYLLTGDSHPQVLQVLEEFLSMEAAELIHDPLERALFQRDLWAVFDWASSQQDLHAMEREALQARLAKIIKRVALLK